MEPCLGAIAWQNSCLHPLPGACPVPSPFLYPSPVPSPFPSPPPHPPPPPPALPHQPAAPHAPGLLRQAGALGFQRQSLGFSLRLFGTLSFSCLLQQRATWQKHQYTSVAQKLVQPCHLSGRVQKGTLPVDINLNPLLVLLLLFLGGDVEGLLGNASQAQKSKM